jgi:hypothetical protein
VKVVRAGIKKPWRHPIEAQAIQAADKQGERENNPLAGAFAADTGEGTRYGSRPKKTTKKHAKPGAKPEQ